MAKKEELGYFTPVTEAKSYWTRARNLFRAPEDVKPVDEIYDVTDKSLRESLRDNFSFAAEAASVTTLNRQTRNAMGTIDPALERKLTQTPEKGSDEEKYLDAHESMRRFLEKQGLFTGNALTFNGAGKSGAGIDKVTEVFTKHWADLAIDKKDGFSKNAQLAATAGKTAAGGVADNITDKITQAWDNVPGDNGFMKVLNAGLGIVTAPVKFVWNFVQDSKTLGFKTAVQQRVNGIGDFFAGTKDDAMNSAMEYVKADMVARINATVEDLGKQEFPEEYTRFMDKVIKENIEKESDGRITFDDVPYMASYTPKTSRGNEPAAETAPRLPSDIENDPHNPLTTASASAEQERELYEKLSSMAAEHNLASSSSGKNVGSPMPPASTPPMPRDTTGMAPAV